MNKIISEALAFNDVLLVPQFSPVVSRQQVLTSSKFSKNVVLGIPIVSANMDTITESSMAIALAQVGGLGIIHRFLSIPDQVHQVATVVAKNYPVGAAVGATGDFLERARALVDSGVSVLVLDIAHGHSVVGLRAIEQLKKLVPVDIVAGNVATYQGALDLKNAGADGVKVGIGNGNRCKTREVSGCGVPQLTALLEVSRALGQDVPFISDGGITCSGDITKALAAGASSVMIGRLFAGTHEVPVAPTYKSGFAGVYPAVIYRGMASRPAMVDKATKLTEPISKATAEGISGYVETQGPVKPIIEDLVSGLRSGMSYCGVVSVLALQVEAQFVKITVAGREESGVRP